MLTTNIPKTFRKPYVHDKLCGIASSKQSYDELLNDYLKEKFDV